MYARIVDGIVVELIDLPDGVPVSSVFPAEIASQLHPCSPEVRPGWLYADGAFSAPGSAPPPSKAELVAYTADLRWRAEQAGTIWNDWPIHTDDRSQGKYLSELQAITLGVRIDGDPWKFADGVFRPVSNADFPQLAIAAREHVRTVFGIETGVLAEIETGTITAPAEIEAAFA